MINQIDKVKVIMSQKKLEMELGCISKTCHRSFKRKEPMVCIKTMCANYIEESIFGSGCGDLIETKIKIWELVYDLPDNERVNLKNYIKENKL